MRVKKYICLAQLIGLSAALYAAVGEVEWFISNQAGMALERAMPLRALRERNALAVREVVQEELPYQIRKYYTAPWRISLSILYENGKRVKTQWVFRDQAWNALFVAAVSNNGSGFIEWYDDQGLLVEEQRLDADGSGYFISYSYTDHILLKAEARLVQAVPQEEGTDDGEEAAIDVVDGLVPGISVTEGEGQPPLESVVTETSLTDELFPGLAGKPLTVPEEAVHSIAELTRNPEGPAAIPEFFVAASGREGGPVWTDFYRYTRSKGLRSIQRIFHEQDKTPETLRFPRFVEGGPEDINFVERPETYTSSFLSDITGSAPLKIDYTFDSKRRIVTETYRGEEDVVIGEIKNVWMNDHLSSVTWSASGDEREVVYGYDKAGERVSEKNYRNGMLERSVVRDEDHEIETLFKNGREVLRAVWVDGQKVSEESIGRSRVTGR
ncbi:MAG: hypothetical protein LBD44_03820 [Spirochaetaceae bacterium]|nr:hypothetical protein [Spirochaetaceae bacterium]